jgi:predicted SPOUT superfamily RNA methylase MTH1
MLVNKYKDLINVISQEVQIDRKLKPGIRLTVELEDENASNLKGKAVSPKTPREQYGLYWGYRTRMADTISKVFTECPFEVITFSFRKVVCFNVVILTGRLRLDHWHF